MNKQGGKMMRGKETECREVCLRHPSPGLNSRYKSLCSYMGKKKKNNKKKMQAFPLSFLLCTNSHVIALNPLPSPSSQATSMTACLPSLWCDPPMETHQREESVIRKPPLFPNLCVAERVKLALLQIQTSACLPLPGEENK